VTRGSRPPAEEPVSGARGALWVVGAVVGIALLWALRGIVMLMAFTLLLAYALDPLVSAIQRLRLPRGLRISRPIASGIVVLGLVAVLGWTLTAVVPQLISQVASLVARLPGDLETVATEIRNQAETRGLGPAIGPAADQIRASIPELSRWLVSWVGRLFGNVLQVLGLAVLPVLTFYLLAEREAVQASLLGFVPEEAHPRLHAVERAVDRALASYVRGQAVVCLVMGVATGALLTLVGFEHTLALGLLVGVAEILPFVGFWVAALTIGLVGLGDGPWRALIGIAIYTVTNNVIGVLVTPRVMGKHLKMHPFVITVSVLAGAELLGPAGVLLALPLAAVAQALVQEFAPGRRAEEASG
jgi:predicted PurR-regulated permease PerM